MPVTSSGAWAIRKKSASTLRLGLRMTVALGTAAAIASIKSCGSRHCLAALAASPKPAAFPAKLPKSRCRVPPSKISTTVGCKSATARATEAGEITCSVSGARSMSPTR
eukprot:7386248-Prymnesium_polylepis.1